MSDSKLLKNRARKKAITNSLVLAMIDIANENGEFEWVKKYWNTYYCQSNLTSHNGRYFCNYCKNRWCSTCCGIRKAYLFNKYYPVLIEWEEPHLLTITLKTIKSEHLKQRITDMINSFNRIKDRCNKRHQRGKGMKIRGIKSLECNFNASKKWYNPHYHIIVPNRVTALYIKQEWKKEWNRYDYNAGEKGQDIRKVENTEKDLVEVIKYGAKILSDPDPAHKRKRKRGDMKGLNIYANALHTIYRAFDKHHLFGSFGFKLPEGNKIESSERFVADSKNWKYNPKILDWENTRTGKLLTEFEMDGYLEYILKYCIDKELS